MKIFVAILALVACVCAEWTVKSSDELKEIRQSCIRNLTEEQIKNTEKFIFHNVSEVRQHVLCTQSKVGVYTIGMGYNVDRAAEQFVMPGMSKAEVRETAEKCINPLENSNQNDEYIAFEIHECMLKVFKGKIEEYVKKQREEAAKKEKKINFFKESLEEVLPAIAKAFKSLLL